MPIKAKLVMLRTLVGAMRTANCGSPCGLLANQLRTLVGAMRTPQGGLPVMAQQFGCEPA